MNEVAPGLWVWKAPHPAWHPGAEPESPDDWPQDVGCVAFQAPGALVLVDPLVADWAPLDALVERCGAPLVLTTMRFHSRSRDAVVARYGGAPVRHDEPPPEGVERIPIEHGDETMVWLPGPRALVPGDRLLGDGAGGLRVCPSSWLRYLPTGLDALREGLRVLLELPVEMVLASHGEPVLRDGRAALEAALARR